MNNIFPAFYNQERSLAAAHNHYYTPPEPPPLPHCPVCKEELCADDTVYVQHGGDVVLGCMNCVSHYEAAEFL